MSTCDLSPAARATAVEAALTTLKDQGYTVTEGVQTVYNTSAFGANPGNPYLVYKGLAGGIAQLPTFKMTDERSAILNVVCTPGSSLYFGWSTYLFAEPFPVVSILQVRTFALRLALA